MGALSKRLPRSADPDRPGTLAGPRRDPRRPRRSSTRARVGAGHVHPQRHLGVPVERLEAGASLDRPEVAEQPAREAVGDAAREGERHHRIGGRRERAPVRGEGERAVRTGAGQRLPHAKDLGVGDGAGAARPGQAQVSRGGAGVVAQDGDAPGQVAQERAVLGDGLRRARAHQCRVHHAQPAGHATRGRGGVTPLLRTDARVLRERAGQGEAQRAPPRPQPLDRRQRRRDGAAGAELAGAGANYFFAGAFLAAFWRLRRAFHDCFFWVFTRMRLLFERAISDSSRCPCRKAAPL